MSGFPQELVFVFVFGAIVLAQFLYRLLRGKAALMQAELEQQEKAQAQRQAQRQAQAQAEAEAAAVLLRAQRKPAQTEDVESSQPTLAPRATPVTALTNVPLPPRSQQPRRFSRLDLMPDRRAVQDAIVIAAIMQPCHAQRPYNVD